MFRSYFTSTIKTYSSFINKLFLFILLFSFVLMIFFPYIFSIMEEEEEGKKECVMTTNRLKSNKSFSALHAVSRPKEEKEEEEEKKSCYDN